MLVVGGAMFLKNITVRSGGGGILEQVMSMFLGSGGASAKGVTGIMLVLIFTMLILTFLKPNVLTIGGLIFSCIVFVFSLIAGMEIKLADMSGLELVVIVGLMLSGLGLTIRSLITPES